MAHSALKPAAFYVPIDFDLTALPERLRWYAAYFLNLIHWKFISYQADEDGFVRLKCAYLLRIIPQCLWLEIKETLVGLGLIECDNRYVVGKKSYGFRLASAHRQTKRVVCDDSKLCCKIRRVALAEAMPLLPVHRYLTGLTAMLEFDNKRAQGLATVAVPDPHSKLTLQEYRTVLLQNCEMIANRDWYAVVDAFGRFHTPLSSLPASMRCCLTVQGEHLIGLDLANSQPLIAGLCARRFYASGAVRHRLMGAVFGVKKGHVYCYKAAREMALPCKHPDVEEYLDCCQKGQFYESFPVPGKSRTEVKVGFFADVFFGSNQVRSPIKTAFTARYPSIATMLRILKAKDHRRSAWILQNIESTIFIYNICGRVMTEQPTIPLFTVHDSLLTIPKNVDYVREVILDEFQKMGLKPTLHEEHYNGH